MNNLESVRKRWLQERDDYYKFGQLLASKLREEIRIHGIWADVTSRAKEIDSLIRKLIKKPNHTYESIGDKTGVRVILRYKDEVDFVQNLAKKLFKCGEIETKVDEMNHDQVGYISVHVDVALLDEDPESEIFSPEIYRAELQVRTLAQHLWSEMAHDTFYKNNESLNPLPSNIKRRVYLLAGVVEVADNEFNRLNTETPQLPELLILNSLERHFYTLTSRRSDPELSLDVIRLLLPLYSENTAHQISVHLDKFYDIKKDIIQSVYEESNDNERSAYLYQPEAIMIYDLLSNNKLGIQKVWNTKYPEFELERFANAFGISFN
ncbi:MAG: hypothetical protein AB2809_12850 [Candidatus Thiodiazotropha sp.]